MASPLNILNEPEHPKEKKTIYRNIFKAEEDLRKRLESYGFSRRDKVLAPKHDGILTDRQRLWISGAPNDSQTENPVLYRYIKLEEQKGRSQQEDASEVECVRGLQSEGQGSNKTSVGVINRIQNSRKERHEACLEELFQELGIISQELEPRITEASNIVKGYLDEDTRDIELELKRIQDDEGLFNLTYKDLMRLWQDISSHFDLRQSWVHQLDSTLTEYEEQRSTVINDTFQSYTDILLRIAHLMPPDVHRLMEEECLKINISLLQNRRSCSDLMRRLLTADIERERQQYLYWENRVDDWKELKVKHAIKSFETFVLSAPIADPPSLTKVVNEFVTEQRVLNSRRMQLLVQLREVKPPNATRSSVLKWHESLIKVTEQLDSCNAKYRGLFDIQHERVIQQCENELKRIELTLFNEGVASTEDIQQIATDHLQPLIGDKKSRFDYEAEKMEKYIEDATAEQKQRFQSLFNFLQGLSQLWDSHDVGLAREDRTLKEKLDLIRKEHDGQNQIREAKLDIVMDRLRQDSTETALTKSLNQAITMLEDIKKSYLDFHNMQTKNVQEYPGMVSEELQRYEETLLNYLGVSALQPKKISRMSVQRNKDITEKSTKDKHVGNKEDMILLPSGQKLWVIPDSPGNKFFRDLTTTDESAKTSYTFLSEIPDGEMELLPYIESFKIPRDTLVDLKKQVRQEFLCHLEQWKKELTDRSDDVVQAKIEEINNELDLRLHLHEPRPTRAERDVHNVRAAELILHRDRITEHCQGVLNELNELKAQFTSMAEEQKLEAENFKHSVEDLEGIFAKAAKSHELLGIQDQVSGKLEKYMGTVRATVRQFRQELEEMLNTIRESNTSCRKSLKTFSEGGNFSPDEVEEFRKKLEKVANKVDNTEGNLMGDLEGMETKRLESAQDAAGKLEERFKYHLFDLTFIEKTTRWLTNIQLKVKSEVADSNSQAQKLAKMIATFDRRIDAVRMPNVDKEQINAKQLHETLVPLIEAFHARMNFLNCAIDGAALARPGTLKAEVLPSKSESSTRSKAGSGRRSRKGIVKTSSGLKSGRTSRASAVSKTDTIKSDTGSKSQSVSPEREINVQQSEEEKGLSPAISRQKDSTYKTKQGGKYDRKYMIFGEDDSSGNNFNDHIRMILRDCLDGILTTAEFYYRQKGSRQPTRNTTIHDNFDHCAEAFIERLRSYQYQTEEYHNSCIQEFRAQMKKFESNLKDLPPLVITDYCNDFKAKTKSLRSTLQESFISRLEGLERSKREYYTLLRPTLGHPKNRADREKLCSKEEQRQTEMKAFVEVMKLEHTKQEESLAALFLQGLNEIVVTMLGQFDAVITTDDVIVGNKKQKKKSQKQLIRERIKQVEEEKTEETIETRGPGIWAALPVDAFTAVTDTNSSLQTDLIKSIKKLGAHEALIKARDEAFEDYKTEVNTSMETVQKNTEKILSDENRWKENWDRSLTKILDLY